MPVRYINVTPVTKLFKPATRAFGDVAVVGAADKDAAGATNSPVPVTNPDDVGIRVTTRLAAAIDDKATSVTVASAAGLPGGVAFRVRVEQEQMSVTGVDAATNKLTVTRGANDTAAAAHAKDAPVVFPVDPAVDGDGWFKGNLGKAVRKALEQSPGPTTVWAVRAADGNLDAALAEVAKLDVQLVVLANTPLTAAAGKADIEALAAHVSSVSRTGGDGKERIGVAMLGKGTTDTSAITGNMSIDRMVMVAHHSSEDAAAAVAGAIAGREPHISVLLKQVKIGMDAQFSDAEIEAFDKARVNWLTDPALIPAKGVFLGEGYTLGADMPYIDIVRTVDDVSFQLKARLIRSIGDLRVSRSGLRTLVSQMTAVLEPLVQREVIEGFEVFLPLLILLDKDPAARTPAEQQRIDDAQNARTVDAIVTVDYAGAVHRLNISLVFK